MKTTHALSRLLLVAFAALALAGSAQASDHRPYRHDRSGYWDEHHRHHAFVVRHGHRGYWDGRSGTRLWIQIN